MSSTNDRAYVIVLRPGPAWVAGQPIQAQDLGRHREHVARLAAAGHVLLAGPFLDATAGGLAVIRARDETEARRIMEDDPAMQEGVFTAELRPFLPLFGTLTNGAR